MAQHPTPTGTPSGAADMAFGMGSRLLYALSRVAIPPLALAHVGLAEYGLWSTCFILVSYIGMAASGFSLVYLRGTAQRHALGDAQGISRLLSTGILTMGTLALAMLAAVWALLPALLDTFEVDPAHRTIARDLWLGAVAVFLADMSLGAFAHVLHAIGRIRQEQKVWVAAFILEALFIVLFLVIGWGIYGLLAAFALRYLFSSLTNAMLALQALPEVRLSWRHFDRSLLPDFFRFGSGMQVSGLMATALGSADRLLAAAFLGPQAAALTDLANKLPSTVSGVTSITNKVAESLTARHEAHGAQAALRAVYGEATRVSTASLALTLPFLAVFAEPLMRAWLGAGTTATAAAQVMFWTVLGAHLHMLTGAATSFARGLGRLGPDFHYLAWRVAALAAGLLIWRLTAPDTLVVLVATLAVSQGLAAMAFLIQQHSRLGGTGSGLMQQVALPTLAAYALCVLVKLSWPLGFELGRLEVAAGTVALGALWFGLTALALARWMLTPLERQALWARLHHMRVWRTT